MVSASQRHTTHNTQEVAEKDREVGILDLGSPDSIGVDLSYSDSTD
jgi:hypothetical protein